jgi:uncharacterized OB-fold protein
LRAKVCFKCEAELPITNFYKHPKMGDGYLGKCKACTRYDVRKNREAKRDYYNAYDRERSKDKGRIAKMKAAVPDDVRKARFAVHNATTRGKLMKKPCEVCGADKVEAHHPDYSKPLDVVWLCRKHHAVTHRPF